MNESSLEIAQSVKQRAGTAAEISSTVEQAKISKNNITANKTGIAPSAGDEPQ